MSIALALALALHLHFFTLHSWETEIENVVPISFKASIPMRCEAAMPLLQQHLACESCCRR
jgi:hypothetical protein